MFSGFNGKKVRLENKKGLDAKGRKIHLGGDSGDGGPNSQTSKIPMGERFKSPFQKFWLTEDEVYSLLADAYKAMYYSINSHFKKRRWMSSNLLWIITHQAFGRPFFRILKRKRKKRKGDEPIFVKFKVL